MLLLVNAVADSAGSARDAVANAAAGVALGLLLVGLLGCLSGLALDGLRDVVGGVVDRVACEKRHWSVVKAALRGERRAYQSGR